MRRAKIILTILAVSFISVISLASAIDYNRPLDIGYSDLTKDAKRQVDCLAENIYHEAGVESKQGKKAVALVTMNRTQDERFPSNICGVVKQKINKTCQFSWFCMPVKINKNTDAYKESMEIALFVYANYENIKDITNGALYYHADYVRPNWKGLKKTTTIGRHIFYKENKVIDL